MLQKSPNLQAKKERKIQGGAFQKLLNKAALNLSATYVTPPGWRHFALCILLLSCFILTFLVYHTESNFKNLQDLN
jgi:hypothetical protein